MRETRPLSERFDLGYVTRRHFADKWARPLTFGFVLLLVAGVAAAMIRFDKGRVSLQGANRLFSSGALTQAHDMFADDCAKCHDQQPGSSGYWLPAADEKCIVCHAASSTLHDPHQGLYVGADREIAPGLTVRVSSNCALCHVEHKGRDHDLNRVPDDMCVTCHADLGRDNFKQTAPVSAGPGDHAALVAALHAAPPSRDEGGAR